MLQHYITITLRTLARNKLYTVINLLGLTVALASALIVTLYVQHELSYDTHFSKADRIYRMGSNIEVKGGPDFSISGTFMPLGPALKQDFPEIEEVVRMLPSGGAFRVGEEQYQDVFYWVDPNLFKVFDTEVVFGDLSTALTRPNTFVITESLALKYFGTANAVGRTMTFNKDRVVEVTAVVKPWPFNSHLVAPMFGSMETARAVIGDAAFESWGNIGINRTYILLRPDASARAVEDGLPAFLSRWTTSESPNKSWLDMLALTDIYLSQRRVDDFPPKGSSTRVAVATFVAFLLILVAAFNFVILTLALAQSRFVEMGLRKVHGARTRHVVAQVIGESCIVMALAYGVAVAVVDLTLPAVGVWLEAGLQLSAASLPIPYHDLGVVFPQSVFDRPDIIGFGFLSALAVGVFAALIPALSIARTGSSGLLGQARSNAGAQSRVGFAMVLGQFATALALVVIGIVVSQQIEHLRSVDLGFNKENLIFIGGSSREKTVDAHSALKSSLPGIPGLISVSRSTHAPTLGSSRSGYEWQGKGGPDVFITWEVGVDSDYIPTMGMEVVAGTDFLPGMTPVTERDEEGNFLSSETPALITETFARKLGVADPADILGKSLKYAGNPFEIRRRIIGIVKPVEFNSGFSESATDMFFVKDPHDWGNTNGWDGRSSTLIVRVAGANLPATLAAIDTKWAEVVPDFPIQRWFLDERFEALYRQSERQSDLFRAGIAVAIVVSAMGLFGLAAFSVQRRTKEVGLRKANGATTWQLIRLMTWDLTKPVLWANVVAWPLAYLVVSRWLESFVLRTEMSPLPYLWATAAGLVIAWAVVAVHVTRVARTHPAHALRYE